jgi:hypothetical protein
VTPGWPRFLTSVAFAAFQLGGLACVCAAGPARWQRPLTALLGVLLACTLTTAWQRRPYDRARLGFLLVHVGPALVLAGLLTSRWVTGLGLACLALGCPWMFYLKPLLKKKDKGLVPPWQRLTLQGTRILFLGAGALLIAPALRGLLPPRWLLVSWLILAVALHLHHVKAMKGFRAQVAGLAAWALCFASYLTLK